MAREIDDELLKSPVLSKIKENDPFFSIEDVEDFCMNEMVGYGREVCSHRALPSYIDGLKESTRKVLWCAKDELKSPLKVYQLCGVVSYKMAYVHGDISLNGAIIGLAQPQNSNLPMLDGIGQFGSYHFDSSASPRYVSVKLSKYFDSVFQDNNICIPQFSDGVECEPKYMLPIIPYALLNNSRGIALGFASNILARNVVEVIKECIKAVRCLKKGTEIKAKILTPEIPGFKGTFTPTHDPKKTINTWDVHGVYTVSKRADAMHIEEFIGSMANFMAALNEKRDAKILSYIQNSDNSYDVKFKLGNKVNDDILTDLHLESTYTENPTFTDEDLNVIVFNHIGEVIPKFVPFRAEFYKDRLKLLIAKANLDILIATNRIRFIKEHELFYKKPNIDKLLDAAKYDRVNESYEYLLSMRVDSITLEKIKALEDKLKELKARLKELKTMSYLDLYENDLTDLLAKVTSKSKTDGKNE